MEEKHVEEKPNTEEKPNMEEKPNGLHVELAGEQQQQQQQQQQQNRKKAKRKVNLYEVLQAIVSPILSPEPGNTEPLLHRIKTSLSRNAPLIPEASRNTAQDLFIWTRGGSPLRPLLVISVGTITLVALTGLLVFMLFFLFATINAIVVSLLVSLAAAGGFLALFFAFVTAIYIGALSAAILAISTVTFWAIVAIMITTAWIGFFYTVWLVTRKSLGFAKHSLCVTGFAISTYSAAWGTRNLKHQD